jgi:hypothetical protein
MYGAQLKQFGCNILNDNVIRFRFKQFQAVKSLGVKRLFGKKFSFNNLLYFLACTLAFGLGSRAEAGLTSHSAGKQATPLPQSSP